MFKDDEKTLEYNRDVGQHRGSTRMLGILEETSKDIRQHCKNVGGC